MYPAKVYRSDGTVYKNETDEVDLALTDAMNRSSLNLRLPALSVKGSLKVLVKDDSEQYDDASKEVTQGVSFVYEGQTLYWKPNIANKKCAIVYDISQKDRVCDAVVGGSKISFSSEFLPYFGFDSGFLDETVVASSNVDVVIPDSSSNVDVTTKNVDNFSFNSFAPILRAVIEEKKRMVGTSVHCQGHTVKGRPCCNATLLSYRTREDMPYVSLCWRHKQQIITIQTGK